MADWISRLPIGTYLSAPVTCACGYKSYLEMEKVTATRLKILGQKARIAQQQSAGSSPPGGSNGNALCEGASPSAGFQQPDTRCPGCGSVEITIDIEVEHPTIHA